MKKENLKLFTALFILVVTLIVGGSIFYACNKEEKNDSSEKALTKETEFVAKNYDGTCVQVNVYRDKNNNAQLVTKDVANDTNAAVSLRLSKAVKIDSPQQKDEGTLVIEIPNDAIYWLVPLDGHDPFKFEPVNNAKTGSGGSVKIHCTCEEGTVLLNSLCKPELTPSGWQCLSRDSRCTKCRTHTSGVTSISETTFVGSTYLVKSDSIVINGITYE